YPRFRGAARRKQHRDPEVLPPHQQAGATRPLRPAPRRSHAQLEDQRGRLHGAGLLGRLTEAYEDAIAATSTGEAPWYVIPSDHKWFRNLAVSQILADTMADLALAFPPP